MIVEGVGWRDSGCGKWGCGCDWVGERGCKDVNQLKSVARVLLSVEYRLWVSTRGKVIKASGQVLVGLLDR